MTMKKWIMQIRGPFLFLSIVLTLYGVALAYHLGNGSINWVYSLLAGIGLLALHISVNVFNEYFDFKSGIDLETPKTPFSGGSGVLPEGSIKPNKALLLAIATLVLGMGIGLFLAVETGWELLVIGLLGISLVIGYTTILTRLMLGEIGAGLGLGLLPVLGVQFVSTEQLSFEAIVASVPSAFLVFNLLLLNEFPDCEADARGGRRHLVITFGKRFAGRIYIFVALSVFLWIAGGVILGAMPVLSLLAFLALPLGLRASIGAIRDYESFEKLIPAQGMNVALTLLTQILLAIGYFFAPFSTLS